MKIAILVPLFPPKWLGGTEIATLAIGKHLTNRGHEVHVLTSLDKGLSGESVEQGFVVHRLKYLTIRFLGIMIFWCKVLLVLKEINPDVLHVQSTFVAVPAFLAKKILHKPYFIWGQGSDIYLPWLFRDQISKLVLKNANAVIALTRDMQLEMQKIYDREVLVIPNGIDLYNFENLSRDKLRAKLQIKENEKILIFVGTLRPVKGVKYLIQAMDIINKNVADVKVIIVGDGPDKQGLQRMTEELNLTGSVKFVGEIPHEKVPEYMAASDVFVLPSISEGFPLTILEAMASGLPIVATKVGGLPEIVDEGENGFLVEPKNPRQIADKLLLLLSNGNLRQRISDNNKRKCKDYDWQTVIDKLENLYIQITSTSKIRHQ